MKQIWHDCLNFIQEKEQVDYYFVIAHLIRDVILDSDEFHLQEFNTCL